MNSKQVIFSMEVLLAIFVSHKRVAIACVLFLFLLVFLSAVSGTSEL